MIQAGDEVHSVERLRGMTMRTFRGPVPVRQIAALVVLDLGLTVGPADAIPAGATRTDWSWSGPADTALNNLLRPLGLYFFEDDGVVRFGGKSMPQADAPRVQVHGPTEVIRKPIVTDEGAELTLFMRPEVCEGLGSDRGGLAYLERRLAGRCVRHNADNWSGPFETWCDLRAA